MRKPTIPLNGGLSARTGFGGINAGVTTMHLQEAFRHLAPEGTTTVTIKPPEKPVFAPKPNQTTKPRK
jgi:hypothetical protein